MILKGVQTTFTSSFGVSRTNKTVTVTILDASGSIVGSGYTAQAVIELGGGAYGVSINFSSVMVGYIKWNNVTDGIIIYQPIVVINNDIETIRKIETNRWKISDNQLIIYDDDATTIYKTFNLFLDNLPNGDAPNERVPA